MKDFNNLVKKTLKFLSKNNIPATPDNYEENFYRLLKKEKILFEDRYEFNEIIRELSLNEKEELSNSEIQSYKTLSKLLSKRVNEQEIKEFLLHLSYFISPSLSKKIKKDIDKFCTEVSVNPNDLLSSDSLRKIRNFTDIRIEEDNSIFNKKNADVLKLIDFLGTFFNKTLNENYITIDKIKEMKDEISSLNLPKSSSEELKSLNSKLIELIEKFENTVHENNRSLQESQKEKNRLEKEIEELQESLLKAEEEKSIDYLTKVLTRRAYSMELERIEKEYSFFDSKYAIVFYDIDYFKKINDSYGHECGDAVLKTFASILKKLTRSGDIICRYGGEEFICIVHYKNIIEINNYLKRVKNIIGNNKFVCNDLKINVKFSAGVSFRNNYTSYDDALKAADMALYEAKDTGRDKIILDNGKIFE